MTYGLVLDLSTKDERKWRRMPVRDTAEESAAALVAAGWSRIFPHATGVLDPDGKGWAIERGDPVALLHAMAVLRVRGWVTPDAPSREARLLAAATTRAEPRWQRLEPRAVSKAGWVNPARPGGEFSLMVAAIIGTNGAWALALEHWAAFGLEPGTLLGEDVAGLRFGCWRNTTFAPKTPRFAGLTQYAFVVAGFAPDMLDEPGGGVGGPALQLFVGHRKEE